MTNYLIPKHFMLVELLPADFYAHYFPQYGQRLWQLFDPRILQAADAIRARYGKMVVNTWFWGGKSQYRGFRPAGCATGAELSQHRFGRAIDLVPVSCTAEEIRVDLRNFCKGADMLDHRNHISRVENKVAWLHIDCANTTMDVIVFINP
jgi:hypothetical protein